MFIPRKFFIQNLVRNNFSPLQKYIIILYIHFSVSPMITTTEPTVPIIEDQIPTNSTDQQKTDDISEDQNVSTEVDNDEGNSVEFK